MEVVQEWSRLDRLTGELERARLEAGRWASSVAGHHQRYGKVVEARDKAGPDGRPHQQQRRQVEVFEARAPGGSSLRVVRALAASSQRWANGGSSSAIESHFGDLELPLNPLDVEDQKRRASVGRSAGRRPPTRDGLSRVSRLCRQLHEEAVRSMDSTGNTETFPQLTAIGSLTDGEDDSAGWERSSDARRSLQLPRRQPDPEESDPEPEAPPKPPEEAAPTKKPEPEDLVPEASRRLSAALASTTFDFGALDRILRSVNSPSAAAPPAAEDDAIKPRALECRSRGSFVTAESLREVRDRLRKLGRDSDGDEDEEEEEEVDDGIEEEVEEQAEEAPASSSVEEAAPRRTASKVRSFVFGLDAMMNQVTGTGSLESRTSGKASAAGQSRTEDWYSRRKSYGFEQVHQKAAEQVLGNRIESSTDSGICRSTELEPSPPEMDKKRSSADPFTSRQARDELLDAWRRRQTARTASPTSEVKPVVVVTIPVAKDSSGNSSGSDTANELVENGSARQQAHQVVNGGLFVNGVVQSKQATRVQINQAGGRGGIIKDNADDRSKKKVEFCKTEVHFAAEPGRVNLVATDEKPPPTNNFRRRRRNSGTSGAALTAGLGLPLTRFGDTSYEKRLFGIYENVPSPMGGGSGAEDQSPGSAWGVKLRPIEQANAPQPRVRPDSPRLPNGHAHSPERPSSWSLVNSMRKEGRPSYSTKVNFGAGKTTVVSDDSIVGTRWSRRDETPEKDEPPKPPQPSPAPPAPTASSSASILNKGLVVRVGRKDSNHTVCSKTIENNTTTTTKITIDLSGPTLKSTPLVMDAGKDTQRRAIPDQLAALKKLYEEAGDDTEADEADEEVRSILSRSTNGIAAPPAPASTAHEEEPDSTVVSGSWGKMRACRITRRAAKPSNDDLNISHEPNGTDDTSQRRKINERDTTSYTRRISQFVSDREAVPRTSPTTSAAPQPSFEKSFSHSMQKAVLKEAPSTPPAPEAPEAPEASLEAAPAAASPIYENVSMRRSIAEEVKEAKEARRRTALEARKASLASVTRKTISSENKEVAAKAVRTRRLQRASSREALLRPHGSSSEDLPSGKEAARRPRSVRRTRDKDKGREAEKTSEEDKEKAPIRPSRAKEVGLDGRTAMAAKESLAPRLTSTRGLPEIKHKTAVSNIRSTAEKLAAREKLLKVNKAENTCRSRTVPGSSSRLREKNGERYRLVQSSSSARPAPAVDPKKRVVKS